jgi:hypothetical protein
MIDPIRDLLISLASHMAYMQGQLEARHELDDPEDYYWYRESVLLRQKVTDALADEPAVREGREPVSVTTQPSDAELDELAWTWYSKTGSTWYQIEAFRAYARAVLARWGNPAPQPVPVSERLPGPEDCDAEGRCWWWHPSHAESGYSEGWMRRPRDWGVGHYDFDDRLIHTHWLPSNALLLPGQEV